MSATSSLKLLNSWKAVGGFVRKFAHSSSSTKCDMKFCVYLPPAATNDNRVPVLYWLSGLTCTEDNFAQKAGAFKAAANEGVALVMPDTSPRGVPIEGDNASWNFGVGAGFYVNATTPKWSEHYRMYDYVTKELPELVQANFPVNSNRSVFGHSMGGHGALISFLKNPGLYKSVSAFSPITNPSKVPWGIKAFTGYLGDKTADWQQYDATELAKTYKGPAAEILIDQGDEDEFLGKGQLTPATFVEATKTNELLRVNLRSQAGYDHSYFFVSSFVDEHIRFHAQKLKQ